MLIAMDVSVAGRRVPAAGVAVLAVAIAGWMVLAGRYGDMQAQPGAMGLGAVEYVGVWALMMMAMMLPAISTVAALYAGSIAASSMGGRRVLRTAALVAGYLLAWTATGAVAYLVALGAGRLAVTWPRPAVWVGAAVLAGAGVYQLSPPKDRCLEHCRAPFALLFRITSGQGRLRDVGAGIRHGAYCIGCCWALMIALVALGAMTLAWMLVFSAVIVAERSRRLGRWVTIVAAVALLAIALAAPWHPSLVAGLHRPAQAMGM
jgi:predicted metal-binding membrane protein